MKYTAFPNCCGAGIISGLWPDWQNAARNDVTIKGYYKKEAIKRLIKAYIKMNGDDLAFYMLITTADQKRSYGPVLKEMGFDPKTIGINGRHNTKLTLWVKVNKEFKVA